MHSFCKRELTALLRAIEASRFSAFYDIEIKKLYEKIFAILQEPSEPLPDTIFECPKCGVVLKGYPAINFSLPYFKGCNLHAPMLNAKWK